MELDCVEIFQAEVWKIILIRIFKIARSQFGNLKWKTEIDAENLKWKILHWIVEFWKIITEKSTAENVAIEYWIQKVK